MCFPFSIQRVAHRFSNWNDRIAYTISSSKQETVLSRKTNASGPTGSTEETSHMAFVQDENVWREESAFLLLLFSGDRTGSSEESILCETEVSHVKNTCAVFLSRPNGITRVLTLILCAGQNCFHWNETVMHAIHFRHPVLIRLTRANGTARNKIKSNVRSLRGESSVMSRASSWKKLALLYCFVVRDLSFMHER